MDIYVGNLAYSATEDDIQQVFETYGQVSSVKIIMDRVTGRSKGFGFVTMDDEEQGAAAVEGLDGREVSGRRIKVNKARPKPTGGGEGGGGGRY